MIFGIGPSMSHISITRYHILYDICLAGLKRFHMPVCGTGDGNSNIDKCVCHVDGHL